LKAKILISKNKRAKNKRAGPMKILVVEDNLDAQTTLCDLLAMLDYQAFGVETAEDALKEIANFDVLLTDINLPGMNGLELAHKIKLVDPSKPIIISSGMEISADIQIDVLTLSKPFSTLVLTEVLEKARSMANL
jgi:CheY-like chemotaxis protein